MNFCSLHISSLSKIDARGYLHLGTVTLLIFSLLLTYSSNKSFDGVFFYEKEYFFRVLSLVLILASVIRNYQQASYSLNIFDIGVSLYSLYLVFCQVSNGYIGSDVVVNVAIFIVLYFALKGAIGSWSIDTISFLFIGLFLCAAGLSFHGFLQFFGATARYSLLAPLSGYYSNPAPYAGLMLSLFSYVLPAYVFGTQKASPGRRRLFELIATGIAMVAIFVLVATKSRAAFFGLLIGFLSMFVISSGPGGRSRIWKVMVCICLALLTCLCLYFIRPDSSMGRLLIWKIASTEMYPEHPIFGSGIESFERFYMKYQGHYFSTPNSVPVLEEQFRADNTPFAFNEYLKILIEQGALGFMVIFGAVFALLYRSACRLHELDEFRRRLVFSAVVSLLCVGGFSFFSYPLNDETTSIIVCLDLAVLSSLIQPIACYRINAKIMIGYFILNFCLASFMIYNFTRKYQAYLAWYNTQNILSSSDYDRLQSVIINDPTFDLAHAKALASRGDYLRAVRILERTLHLSSNPTVYLRLGMYTAAGTGDWRRAEVYLKTVYSMLPLKLYPRYVLLRIYIEHGQDEKATALAAAIVSLPVRIESPLQQKIQHFAKSVLEATSARPR